MPQSLSFVIVHVIFSTKERRPLLDTDTRPKLHAYLATVGRNAGCECGGLNDGAGIQPPGIVGPAAWAVALVTAA